MTKTVPSQVVADRATTVAFVSNDPLWPQAWATTSFALHAALLEQGHKHRLIMALTGRHQEDKRFAASIGPQASVERRAGPQAQEPAREEWEEVGRAAGASREPSAPGGP